ncbi:29702_t:CDS:2 [Gigaspora margarita]|uniref:29702_t:CDS:1 n=1 Tax=Gigaspora margarita TaxID=4874 RepID=A0ABN7VCN4_GIGMA|nr:29702_t:CDS:2 [Gigaspora margarita]
MNAILKLKNLDLDRIEGFDKEILFEKELEKDKNPMFESTKDLKMYDRSIGEKDKINKLENLTKMDNANCKVLDEFDQKEKKAAQLEVDLPGAKTLVIVSKNQSHVIPILNISTKPQLLNLIVNEVLDTYYDINETVGEPFNDAVFGFNKKQKK